MAESLPISDSKSLTGLYTTGHQDRRYANSKLRQICALDTETHDGDIFLIADSEGNYLDKITPKSVIKWLFSKRYEGTWNFFYNLTFDAGVILKLLGENLKSYLKTRSLDFSFEGYSIQYIHGKKLAIKKGHHSTVFFDIAQFYHMKLVDAYQSNIGKLPEEYLKMKQKRSHFTKRFYNRNKQQVRNYCITDCILTKRLAEKWITLFHDAFEFYPNRWISSGYLAEKVLINNEIDIPKFNTVPYKIQELAFRCYFGGRFEMLKRGFIGTGYIYDINSAYPYALTKIPNLSKGRWIKRKSIHPDSKLGFFRIKADIPDLKHVPPFPFRNNNMIIFPSGKFETFCTLPELLACNDESMYEIIDSYQFIPDVEEYPYKNFITEMYQKRLKLKQDGSPLQLPIKLILNSIYGKTGQRINRKIGNLFNPIIFSAITGHARAQLYEFVQKHKIEREIVAFATDSVCTTRKITSSSNELGVFSLDKSGDDVFFLQNGIYRINGKWKQRGLGHLGTKEIEHLDTVEKDGKLFYKFKVLRAGQLRSSIIQNNIEGIGKFSEITRQIDLNADNKRIWLGNLKNIDEETVNFSISISLNHFKNI
ncbi:DNA polymerase [Nitrosopumilus adriaticus]|uniref:DNA-directed DNA polymerase n=1 Tax=Nitrosopumilus adriaticus TaxID=1580092 RepID=A0A0D5C3W7_9ARCH|nr:DNA polymerase [Nitrosopumilus adriaticus]AJW71040.1 Type B DNA polymerase [Nitrosopumilus adriaticus]